MLQFVADVHRLTYFVSKGNKMLQSVAFEEYLINITDNLVINPNMDEAISYSLLAKNTDGTDRFNASDISLESSQLVDKTAEYCQLYTQNLYSLSQYSNLNSNDIVCIAESLTNYPEIKNEIINIIESGNVSGETIAAYCTNYEQNKQEIINQNPNYKTTSIQQLKNNVITQYAETIDETKNQILMKKKMLQM